jgi:predicted pyridoxine 5'-phosphate oxidase superfamily flavin-nucleotide-binding protein
VGKVVRGVDKHLAAWIARTTFVAIATNDAAGRMDVSPEGHPVGFIKVRDDRTLVIPDRIGNRRM